MEEMEKFKKSIEVLNRCIMIDNNGDRLEDIRKFLKYGISPYFPASDGTSAVIRAIFLGKSCLVEEFLKDKNCSVYIKKLLEGPYQLREFKINFRNKMIFETKPIEKVYEEFKELEGIKEGAVIEIKLDNDEVFEAKSSGNNLFHAVCKDKNFDVKTLKLLVDVCGKEYLDVVNDMGQTPEIALKHNIYVSDELKKEAERLIFKPEIDKRKNKVAYHDNAVASIVSPIVTQQDSAVVNRAYQVAYQNNVVVDGAYQVAYQNNVVVNGAYQVAYQNNGIVNGGAQAINQNNDRKRRNSQVILEQEEIAKRMKADKNTWFVQK